MFIQNSLYHFYLGLSFYNKYQYNRNTKFPNYQLKSLIPRMQQHYQVINLHNIIRSQQSKIQQLRQQLRIANERQQVRYTQFAQNHKNILEEKDKMIEFLKEELTKSQTNRNTESQSANERLEKEKERMQKQLILNKRKCIQLQAKVKRSETQYQMQLQTYKQQMNKMNQEVKKYHQYKTNISLQVTKLNHFYKNSLFQIGKRKQTLLWVDKFTEYLQKQQIKDKRTLEDISSFLKLQINYLKNNLAQLVTETANSLLNVHIAKVQIYEGLNKALQEVKQDCLKITAQSDQFWNRAIKEQRQHQKKQQIRVIESELKKLNTKYIAQTEQLKNLVKNLQAQKKTLILGFQELRSLTDHKQNLYKEQIQQLKKTIEELIDSATQRDKQFERQIKVLTSQIQNISDRYYQNIQNPMKRVNVKISEQMQIVKSSLSKIQSDSSIKASLQNIQKILNKSLQQQSLQSSQTIQQYVISSNKMLEQLFSLFGSGKQNNSFSRFFSSKGNTFEKEYDQLVQQQQVNLRQKYNKSQYQITLSKKHLAKLKQYCESLQKKLIMQGIQKKPSGYKYSPQKTPTKRAEKPKQTKQSKLALQNKQSQRLAQLNRKILQLQAENEALKQNQNFLKVSCQSEIENIKKKHEIISISEENIHHTQQAFKASIYKLNQINNKIMQYLKNQKEYIAEVRESIKLLKHVIVKPMESFQMFFKEVWEVGVLTQNQHDFTERSNSPLRLTSNLNTQRYINSDRQSPYHQVTQINTERPAPSQISQITEKQKSYLSHFSASDQIKSYKQIILKKNQNSQNTNRLLTQLIRTIRESNIKQLKQKLVHTKKQEQIPKKSDNRLRNIQRKFKQMQTQRIKQKQQAVDRVKDLQGKIQKLNTKISKYIDLKGALTKLQSNLDSKINQIVSKTQVKMDKTEILAIKDEVINDLKSKLQEVNIQNQGLRKQMSIHFAERKN